LILRSVEAFIDGEPESLSLVARSSCPSWPTKQTAAARGRACYPAYGRLGVNASRLSPIPGSGLSFRGPRAGCSCHEAPATDRFPPRVWIARSTPSAMKRSAGKLLPASNADWYEVVARVGEIRVLLLLVDHLAGGIDDSCGDENQQIPFLT